MRISVIHGDVTQVSGAVDQAWQRGELQIRYNPRSECGIMPFPAATVHYREKGHMVKGATGVPVRALVDLSTTLAGSA